VLGGMKIIKHGQEYEIRNNWVICFNY